ncbi:MAG: MFS transporter, partial [Burkholderiales bacterium]
LAIIFTYLTITISYLLRPVGGLILGHLGDKYGRKSVFTISILLMSVPSFVIGLLPTFNQLGYLATGVLITARILQGFSLGGEVPGSITYIAEKFGRKNYFFFCAWLTFGANIGLSLGSQTLRLLNQYTSPEFMYSIGWRIPFLIGGFLSLVGFYIRKTVRESEQFEQLQQTKELSKAPLLVLIKEFKPQIISGILLCVIVSLTTSIFHVFLPNLLVTYSHFSLNTASNLSAIGATTMAIFSLLFAYLTCYIAAIWLLRWGLISLILLLSLMLSNIINLPEMLNHNATGLYIVISLISVTLSSINGIFFGILASLFPTRVRFSGISICYNFAYIIGAGLTPLWTSSLLHLTGKYEYIIAVCVIVSVISLFNTYLIKRYAILLK